MLDVAKFVGELHEYIARAIAPMTARIKELESRPEPEMLQGPAGEKGDPGKDADPVDLEALADLVLAKLLVSERLDTLADLKAAEAVALYIEEHPIRDGQDGLPGRDGERGEKGAPGANGRDGLDVKDLFRADGGRLMAVMSDGSTKDLGVFVGKDGAPGAPGKDGADFTDAELDYDGERGLIIRGKGSEIVKRMPIPIDRGYWREGMKAEKGDVLTHDGSAWIALKDTDTKPCRESSADWRMMARKGRDGAPGPAGKEYRPPEPVKLGDSNG